MTESRSGYAREIMPGILNEDELQGNTVPPAKARDYLTPKPKVGAPMVSIDQAMANLNKRTKGELAPLGEQVMPPQATKKLGRPPRKAQAPSEGPQEYIVKPAGKTQSYDPFGDQTDPETGAEAVLNLPGQVQAGEQNQYPQRREAPDAYVTRDSFVPKIEGISTNSYARQRQRITLSLQDGDMSLACVDILVARYGITVLLPMADDSVIFTPRPGTELTVSQGDRSWPCYFPGVTFELPVLQCMGLVFILRDVNA